MVNSEVNALKRLGRVRSEGRWYIDALEAQLEYNGPGRMDPGWFHPSALGHQCDAFLAFQFIGAPAMQHIAARNQRIFDLGSARDEALKKLTRKAGVSLIKKDEDRKIVIEDYRIRGELDEWVENPITKKRYIVDFKTMHNDEFIALEEAKPAHAIQILPYEFGKQTANGFILYENKNNQEWKVKPANFSNDKWNEILLRLERVLNGLRGGYVRRMPITNESSCPFYPICSSANIPKLVEESQIKL